jgi:hypothetical protein
MREISAKKCPGISVILLRLMIKKYYIIPGLKEVYYSSGFKEWRYYGQGKKGIRLY